MKHYSGGQRRADLLAQHDREYAELQVKYKELDRELEAIEALRKERREIEANRRLFGGE